MQNLAGPAVVLVWMEPNRPEKVRLSLHQLSEEGFALKSVAQAAVVETTVQDGSALWLDGPYLLKTQPDNVEVLRLIEGHVLLWTESIDGQEVTCRLETDLPLEEARRVAESLE